MSVQKLSLCREISYDAFIHVTKQQMRPDEATDLLYRAKKSPIQRIDRNFITEVVYGSLRWYSKLHWILQKTSKRDLTKLSPEVRAALILGTYQIFYMDRVPDRAAVNESVEYIRHKGQSKAVPFVNGVLRSIARRSEYFAKPNKDKQPSEFLALQYAHPRWIIDRWSRRFNYARVKSILSANNQKPPYTVRINSIKVPHDQGANFRNQILKEEKNHSDIGHIPTALYLKSFPNIDKDSLFRRGFFSIQDEASQLIGFLVSPQKNTLIYDACSGPGGKTAHLYELTAGQAEIHAIEKTNKQIEKAKESFARLGHSNINLVHKDFLEFCPKQKADKILLDAPCSGLGTIRRHPEAKLLKKASIVESLLELQQKLITHALSLLKPGGELIYSVCSFETEETIDHLTWLKENFSDQIKVISPRERLSEYYKKFVTKEGILLIYTDNRHNMDGFGAFIIEKIK